MDPFVTGSLITGLGSFIGGLFGNKNKSDNIDKQIAAQKEENKLNREYNLNLAKMQNQWNIEQWNRENAYNTPLAQRQRMVAAGLNPDLMYGEGGVSNVAAVSPELTAGAPSSPVDMSNLAAKPTFGEVLASSINNSLAGARVAAMQSEGNKREKESQLIEVQTGIASADLVTRAAQNEMALSLGSSQIYLNHAIADLNHAQKEEVAARITNLNAQTDKLFSDINVNIQRIKNMEAEVVQMEFERWYKSSQLEQAAKRLQQDIKESNSRIQLNDQQCKDMIATLSARLLNLNSSFVKNQADAERLYAELGIVSIMEGQAKYNLDVAKEWTDVEKTVDVIGKSLSAVSGALGTFFSVSLGLRGGKKPPSSGATVNRPYYSEPSY